jgi:DNA-binding response OmpR family regulator
LFSSILARVLVVDDEEDVRNLVKVILEAEGYSVDVTSNGEDAQKILKKKRFDLLILDVVMPQSDGLELCRKIRHDKKLRDTPVIMFSALGKGIRTMLSEDEKANDYLDKPFEKKILVEMVNKLIKKTG